MNTENIVKYYNQIQEKHTWMRPLETQRLCVEQSQVTQQELTQTLQAFDPKQGWLQTLDKVQVIQGNLNVDENDWIESGELINGNGDSLHIRPANGKKLNCIEMKNDESSEEYFVSTTQHQIKHKTVKGIGTATYQLYWSSKELNTQAQFSRLVAIEFKG